MLDDPRNDIFVHMDLKYKGFNQSEVEQQVKTAGLYFLERRKVNWGAYSFVDTELQLLRLASGKRKYQHYHLMSDSCLPIKSQDEIVDFFESNDGVEFVDYQSKNFTYSERVRYYYFFQEKIGKSAQKPAVVRAFNRGYILIQKLLGINRNSGQRFYKGETWWSITDELARYVISKEDWIKKTFKYAYIGEEIFMQSLVMDSQFSSKLHCQLFNDDHHSIMRLIDWQRGTPYVYRIDDFQMIMESDMLFARKFDGNLDGAIIDKIEKTIG